MENELQFNEYVTKELYEAYIAGATPQQIVDSMNAQASLENATKAQAETNLRSLLASMEADASFDTVRQTWYKTFCYAQADNWRNIIAVCERLNLYSMATAAFFSQLLSKDVTVKVAELTGKHVGDKIAVDTLFTIASGVQPTDVTYACSNANATYNAGTGEIEIKAAGDVDVTAKTTGMNTPAKVSITGITA